MMSVKLDEALLAGLEQFTADRNEPPRGNMTLEDAVNVIVRDGLMGQGYLSLPDDPDFTTPALDAARVKR